jgi:hypothetical protein
MKLGLVARSRLVRAITAMMVLSIMSGCSGGLDRPAPPYVDPRLVEADFRDYAAELISLHGKTLSVRHVKDEAVGGYSTIYVMAEVRDSDANVPVLIDLSDKLVQRADIPVLVNECYRFYARVVFEERIIDPVTGADRTLPVLSGEHFEPVAHDGIGGCESP